MQVAQLTCGRLFALMGANEEEVGILKFEKLNFSEYELWHYQILR